MEKKVYLSTTVLIAAMASIVTFAATSWWTFETNKNNDELVNHINEVDEYIDEYYYGDYDKQTVIDYTLKGMVAGLEDPYSGYMNSDEYTQNIISTKGSVTGIGVTVTLNEDNLLLITEVTKGGPAEECGILAGDIITNVDDMDVSELGYNEAVNHVRGEIGTDVKITVLRNNNTLDFTVTRREIITPTVTGKILDDNIGYIRITSFKETTTEQYKKELKKCLDSNVKAIIFDVRDNGGGLVSSCSECLDPLLPEGEIAIAEFKDGSTELICESDKSEIDIPVAVLINQNSASAAELFTAALRDFKNAQIVGKNTYGKGIMQNTYSLENGDAIRLTIAKYRTTKSECYHGAGIAPDFEVELPEKYSETAIENIPQENDTQLQKAIDILKQ